MALKKTIGKLKRKVSGYMTRKRQENLIVAKIRRTEKLKQREETAKYSEKIAGEQRRRYVSAGGLGGELRRGFGGAAQAFGGSVVGQPRLARRPKKRKKRKKKK